MKGCAPAPASAAFVFGLHICSRRFTAVGVALSDNHVFVAAYDRGLFILNHFTPLSGPALSFALPALEGSSLRVSVQGLPGLRIEVQRSPDLLNWQTWTNGVLGSSPLEFRDPDPNLRQFYRAFAP